MRGSVMANKRSLEVIWDVLHEWQDYQEHVLNQVDKENYEERWDNICTAMAWIKEDLEDLQYANKTRYSRSIIIISFHVSTSLCRSN